jgi:hypothetical protein
MDGVRGDGLKQERGVQDQHIEQAKKTGCKLKSSGRKRSLHQADFL